NSGGSKTTSTRERTPSGSGVGASATARDRRRHPLASARRQARGWERAQRRGIEDDNYSRAHAVRLGGGSERNGEGSKTITIRERTPSGSGLGRRFEDHSRSVPTPEFLCSINDDVSRRLGSVVNILLVAAMPRSPETPPH